MEDASFHKYFVTALSMKRLDYVILSERFTVKSRELE